MSSLFSRVMCRADRYEAAFGAQQGHRADCLQRPLLRRSRFRQQLMPGVAMTSNVKSCQQIFLGFHDVF